MKRMGLVGMVVAVVFGAGAVFAVAASAAPPEFLKKTKFTLEGLTAIFKGKGGTEMKCSTSKGEGEVVVEKTKVAKAVKLAFKGCKLALVGCKSTGAVAEEVVFKALEGELGYIKPGVAGAEHVAFGFAPAVAGPIAEYTCGVEKFELKGCVAGEFSKAGVETNTFSVGFEEMAGEQKILAFEKTLKGEERKCVMEDKLNGSVAELVGLETNLTMKTMEMEKVLS